MATLLRSVPRVRRIRGGCQHLYWMVPDSCLASKTSVGTRNSYSSWDIELPFSSALNEEKNKSLFQRIQSSRKEHQQKLDLQDAVMILVKDYLKKNHKDAFAIESASEFWKKKDQEASKSKDNKENVQKRGKNRIPAIAIHDALVKLAELNGFKPVDLPHEQVPLAEGVVVRPQYHKEESYRDRVFEMEAPRMWARREPKTGQSALPTSTSVMSSAQPRQDDLPELVEEDIKLYRIIESALDEYLQTKYQAMRATVKNIENKIEDKVNSWVPSLRRQDASSSKPKKTELEDQSISDSPESLLFIDQNEIIWVSNMDDPRLRLLALVDHHNYGLKVSSWMISISLVVFGALPLAYRSYNFTYDYPGLSQTVAASVVLTISWGIYSTQSTAVSRQSHVVSNAISHRIYARNNAVLWALQQGAVEQVTDALLTYYFHCQNDKRQRLRVRPSSTSKPLLAVMRGGSQKESETPPLPSTSVDVIALAQEIGLVQEDQDTTEESKGVNGRSDSKRVAVPIETAISVAKEYHKKMKV